MSPLVLLASIIDRILCGPDDMRVLPSRVQFGNMHTVLDIVLYLYQSIIYHEYDSLFLTSDAEKIYIQLNYNQAEGLPFYHLDTIMRWKYIDIRQYVLISCIRQYELYARLR